MKTNTAFSPHHLDSHKQSVVGYVQKNIGLSRSHHIINMMNTIMRNTILLHLLDDVHEVIR